MRKPFFIFAVFAILYVSLSVASLRQKSVTSDETVHIPAGYTYAKLGDYRLNPEHPPLIKLLASVPLLFKPPTLDPSEEHWVKVGQGKLGWRHYDQWLFASKFLYEWNDANQVVFLARLSIILLAVLLGCCVGLCAWELYGWQAGVMALLLYLLTPDLLAHGQLVTTDLGAACFLFLSVYAFYRTLQQMTLANVLLTGAAVALALVSKFSGVIVFPMMALVALAYAYSGERTQYALKLPAFFPAGLKTSRPVESFFGKLLAGSAVIAITVVIGVIGIWAAYGFRYSISPSPSVSISIDWIQFWAKEGTMRSLLKTMQLWNLLPEGYTLGFFDVLDSVERRSAFLLGERSETGWWYYFLITFLVKTPIPLIVLILLAMVFIRRYGAGFTSEAMLLAPVVLYWGIALTSTLNIGHRHLLPIYPFLIVFASKLGKAFAYWKSEASGRLLAAACALLLIWNGVETARVYPNFLTYFNQIAGGPSGGYKWLVDSNLDWGQDLKGLAQYQREHSTEPLYLAYFGTANPAYYGVNAKYLPSLNLEVVKKPEQVVRFSDVASGSLVAVSATTLQCVFIADQQAPGIEKFMARLKELTPITTIGHSIFIYRMP